MWENINGCAEKYRCATVIYLLSTKAHEYNIIINCGVGAPGHVREVEDFLNATYNFFLSMLMITVQLTSVAGNDTQMAMKTSIVNKYINISIEFQKHTSLTHHVKTV